VLNRSSNCCLLTLLSFHACFGEEKIEAFRTCMGTQFRVTVYASDIAAAQHAIGQAFQRAETLDAKLSDYKPDSELNQLCRAQRMVVSDDLYRVLDYAQRVAHESGGAFDVTLGPLIRLWREARARRTLPRPAALAEARRRGGYRKLTLLPRNEVRLSQPDMQLDLGGIAKGFAADEMLRVLREAGFPRTLVAASGDLAIGDGPWRIELGATGEVRELSRCAVSTSGDESQFVEIDGVRYSHIIDPKTGVGAVQRPLVTVIARSGLEADALATAVSAGSMSQFKRLQKAHPNAEIISPPNRPK
jgi:thiamine biosynthesis lipoprotein